MKINNHEALMKHYIYVHDYETSTITSTRRCTVASKKNSKYVNDIFSHFILNFFKNKYKTVY